MTKMNFDAAWDKMEAAFISSDKTYYFVEYGFQLDGDDWDSGRGFWVKAENISEVEKVILGYANEIGAKLYFYLIMEEQRAEKYYMNNEWALCAEYREVDIIHWKRNYMVEEA